MINISKVLAVGSLLLNGISASSSDWDKYDTGLAFGNFYDFQKDYVLCKGDYKCMDSKDEYLNLFDDDCQICFPKGDDEIYNNGGCYSKQQYDSSVAQGIETIIKWDHTITDINPIPESEYGEYGYGSSTVYTVTVEVDREYTRDECQYRTYETEEFKIDSGKISSYEVINIRIKDRKCGEQYYTMTKPPISWEKSTESPTTPNTVPPIPTSKPTWAPVTLQPTTGTPTTAAPVTARPTTPAPVTPAPVTPSPVTPAPVTPAPVTPAPVTPAPVTPSPVTPAPVTPAPVTPAPVTPVPVTPAPVTPAPVTPAPVTPAPVTPAPVTPVPTPFPTSTIAPTLAPFRIPIPDRIPPTQSPSVWQRSSTTIPTQAPIPVPNPSTTDTPTFPTIPVVPTQAPVPFGGFTVPTQSPNPGGILTLPPLPTQPPSTTVSPTPPLNTPLVVPTQSPSPQISTTWTTSTPMKCNCDGDNERSGSWGGRRGLRGGKKNKKGGKNKGGSWGKGKGGKKYKGGSWSNSYDDDEEECDYGYKCVKENEYDECGICIRYYGESRY